MKTQLGILKLVLCSVFATTPVLGQTIYTWTNSAGGDLANPTNYSPNGVPFPWTSDTILFDGQSAGPVVARSNTGAQVGGSLGAYGLQFHITGNQTNPVSIITTVSERTSSGLRSDDFTIDSGAGPFHLGSTSMTNALDMLMGGTNGQVHTFLNNSTNPATIYPSTRWRHGGCCIHYFVFDGTGNWHVTNYLIGVDGTFIITKQGAGTMIWTGGTGPYNANGGYLGSPFTISAGAVILKSTDLLAVYYVGGRRIVNNGLLEFDATGSGTLWGRIFGIGQLKVSNGTLRLATNNTYTGANLVTGGTLIINGTNLAASTVVSAGTLGGKGTLSGAVTLGTGTTLAPGELVGTLTINNDLSIGGDVAVEVDKSLVQSNDLVLVSGVLTNTGAGTLTVANLGPALTPGEKFTLFSQPLLNGATLTVTGAGATWVNNLEVDGSISVTTVTVPTLNYVQTSNALQFSWDASFGYYKLQAQTNSLDIGLGSNWADYPGGGVSPVEVPVNITNGSVFLRLISP